MVHKPFFSIIIPTYNRAQLLKATLTITLKQSFQNFEIIVSNNCSTDETRDVVRSFSDKRIRYYENNKNIGGEPNMKKAMSYARGKYIFTMGDDDFILYEDTLGKVKKIIEDKKYDFIRLNLIERKFIGKGIRKSIITTEKDIEFKKGSSAEEILDFFHKIAVGHFAGLIIKNSSDLSNQMNNCSVIPWIKIVYPITKKKGALFLSNYYMLITWSQGEILTHYDVRKNNRLMFEDYTDFIFSVMPKDMLGSYKLRYFNQYIIHQPVIKLYSTNLNLIKFDKRLLALEPRLKYNVLFWLSLLIALMLPNFFWRMVRVLQHKNKNILDQLENKDQIYKKFAIINRNYT